MCPKISVIIPIYNTAQYLSECLESVCAQTFCDIEIICINDGSTDKSLEILKQYTDKDSRIVIIDQPNQGVSAARNAGLEVANGKYVAFVDGDDTVAPDFLYRLFTKAESTGAQAVYSNILGSTDGKAKELTKQDIITELLPQYFSGDLYNSVCNKLYRSATVRAHAARFPLNITHGEDAHFNIEFLVNANKISLINYSGYYYREVEGSATRNIRSHDYLKRIIEVYHTDWSEVIGGTITADELIKLKQIRFVHAILALIYIYGNRGNHLTDWQRWRKLREIVNHPQVKAIFSTAEFKENIQGRYSRAIFKSVRNRNAFLLYLFTQYSYYRSK